MGNIPKNNLHSLYHGVRSRSKAINKDNVLFRVEKKVAEITQVRPHMQFQVLTPHFGKGIRNYLQIPLRDGFFLHTELQVLHFPGEGKRQIAISNTQISMPFLSSHCTWASPAQPKSERRGTQTNFVYKQLSRS